MVLLAKILTSIHTQKIREQSRRASSRVLGEEHPSTLTSMGNLASTYWNQGRWKEAEELEVQVMGTGKGFLYAIAKHGKNHRDSCK
jgi:hypothetical protein